MTTATYTTAHAYACPAGHMEPAGGPLRMIVPDGLELAPACPACRRPLARIGGPLEGAWRVDECCTPAGPGGRWAGPPRDPAVCAGTRRHALCLACLAVNCDGDHGGQCVACDATGTENCPACQGEGRLYDRFGDDAGPCAAGCEERGPVHVVKGAHRRVAKRAPCRRGLGLRCLAAGQVKRTRSLSDSPLGV